MDIKDLAGLSDPLCKFIDVFQKGCSWTFKPQQIKRIASATSQAKSIESNDEFKSQLKQALLESTANAARSIREERQFNNIASIYANAAQELQMIENIDKIPVDPDWSARFFDYAKDISDEEVQIVWAKILAGEIIKPGSFFKRTLSALRDIEALEAKWFADICQFVLSKSIIHDYCLTYDYYPMNQFQSLTDCGLINSIKCQFVLNKESTEIQGKTQSIKLISPRTGNTPPITIPYVYTLTDVGAQLYRITPAKSHQTYMMKVKEYIEKKYNIKTELIQIEQ